MQGLERETFHVRLWLNSGKGPFSDVGGGRRQQGT